MTAGRLIWLALVYACAASVHAATAGVTEDEEVLTRAHALHDAFASAAQQRVDDIRSAADSGDQIELLALLRTAYDASDMAPAARERIMYEGAMLLAQISPLPAAARDWLSEAAAYRSQVRVWHEDSGQRSAVVLYEVSAAARFALRRAAIADLADEYRAALTAGVFDPARLGEPDAADAALRFEAARDAIAKTSPGQVAVQAGLFMDLTGISPQFDRLIADVALRGADLALAAELMARGSDAVVIRSFARLAGTFGEAHALGLLQTAASRAALRSAAFYQAAKLSPALPAARTWLFERLDDAEDGRLAAAALASCHDADTARGLHDWLLAQPEPVARKRALLALRLDGSASAREHLARLAHDARLSPALRKEISQWHAH